MNTITISKKEYMTLEKRATLYNQILKSIEKEVFPIENYSPSRLKEFFKGDKLNSNVRNKVQKLLQSDNITL
ncbi:MAG: hypothetical protein HY093_05045 [Candidatus Liptonbacteria bacterium]|nr:hypothetical protein [Candidatus Liptonbacteria bacterium]